MRGSCPCLYVEPCHPDCTCMKPWMSRGCVRCCSTGNVEQRTKKAKWLADIIDQYVEKQNVKEQEET